MVSVWLLSQAMTYTAQPSSSFSWLSSSLLNFLSWLFNPASLIQAGFTLFAGVMWLISAVLPAGPVKDEFANLGTYGASVPVTAAWGCVTYMISPFVNTTILNVCVTVRMMVWILSIVIRYLVWCLNLIWTHAS